MDQIIADFKLLLVKNVIIDLFPYLFDDFFIFLQEVKLLNPHIQVDI